jgi:hypothetical protein
MEQTSFQLRINVDEKYYKNISSIIGHELTNYKYGWFYEIIFEDLKEYYCIISKFLDLLEGKYDELLKYNIKREDITIWIIFQYENQCNMEFNPNLLKRLRNNGITLCISC